MENIIEKKKNIFVIDNFWLKLVALFTMTLDHVGYLLESMYLSGPLFNLSIIFRTIGRLAIPLFAFMISEGVKHTRNFPRYILRLSIMLTVMLLAYIITEYVPLFKEWGIELPRCGIIFIDLILGALGAYCINHKNNLIKSLTILPIAFSILSFVLLLKEYQENILITFLPYYLRCQYGFVCVLLIIAFSLCDKITTLLLKQEEKKSGINASVYVETEYELFIKNIISIVALVLITLVNLFVSKVFGTYESFKFPYAGVFAGILIFFYSGKRGYNKPWFSYGCYLYYPVHFILIFLIYNLILIL